MKIYIQAFQAQLNYKLYTMFKMSPRKTNPTHAKGLSESSALQSKIFISKK